MLPQKIHPVILAGGSGTRLWPLSRKNHPKQFLRLNGELSLLQQTFKRVSCLQHATPLVVSNDAHYFLCHEQLKSFKSHEQYILEPCARNTAPAIASAAHYIAENYGPDAIMLILPSDHWIGNDDLWAESMNRAAEFLQQHNNILTFGIKPTSPQTGYGYIEANDEIDGGIKKVKRFTEKPNEEKAKEFVNEGNFYWNSGMFMAKAEVLLEDTQQHADQIFAQSKAALLKSHHHHDFIRLDFESFKNCPEDSIDYAIMEKTTRAAMMPLSVEWSDLGCWNAVADANDQDENGNTLKGNVISKDSQNCLISSEDTLVTTLGIKDQIIVATRDAILVADKKYSQQVKEIVTNLGKQNKALANDHKRVFRPWDYYEVLIEGPQFKVKRIMVNSGASLSLQMHNHRAEHWVVIGGKAEVINGENMLDLSVNESTYIPQKTMHRLSNRGQSPLYVIEVQTGSYLGEDDIIRFDDVYRRNELEKEPV